MRTIRGRVTLLVALLAVAACFAASQAHASRGVRYGIQDDAWLEFGPGTLDQRLATFKRLGVPLVRFTLHWNQIATRRPTAPDLAARSRLRLASIRQNPARPSPLWPDAGAHAGRDAGVGERGPRPELRPAAAPRLSRLRARGRQALPLGSLLADLERAEPAPLAEADEGSDLCPAPAQPRIRRDSRRAATCPGRRRRDGAAGRAGGRLARRLDSRHGRRPREARRLRPPPVPVVAGRDAVEPRLSQLPVDHDGDDSRSCSSWSGATSGRSRSGSPSTATRRIRLTRSSASRRRSRRRC